jgi:hypothetical protein
VYRHKRSQRSFFTQFLFFVGRRITRDQLLCRWKKACKSAGVSGLWIHDREFIKPISGHKTDYAFKRYARPTLEDLPE